ncbi:ENVT1 protein, partial [Phaetusa simplex]|nr:ENVT1 protein [Phaetusa simplex]
GFHSFVRAIFPTLGIQQLEQTLVNISAEMELIANATAAAITALQIEVQSLKEVVWQNCRVLDLLTVQAGGVCTLINESCCAYIDQSGVILSNVQ